MKSTHRSLLEHQDLLSHCRRCPRMQSRRPVIGNPDRISGAARWTGAGPREPTRPPFAWTAGKMLFKWFEQIGIDEQAFRGRMYMAAVSAAFRQEARRRRSCARS